MAVQRYDIFFSGKTIENADPETVKQKIARIFNASGDQLEHLFSGASVKIKNNIDQDTAIKYRVAFKEAGALIEIRSADPVDPVKSETSNKPATTDPSKATAAMSLLPPNTGSLIDCAPTIQPAVIPDTDYLTLANPGTVLDESSSPAPISIDTSEFTLTPANTGSLEDCQIQKKPAPLPDISQLKIVESND
ncbi:MAG: hypothetical protein OQK92_08495 [Sedimenticola sp.]|nr:hypothetical protein [Sedimenticola sp.]